MKTKTIIWYGVYLAFFLIMTFVPEFGYIATPRIDLTLMLIPVSLISLHFGVRGAIFGFLTFAILSYLKAIQMGNDVILNTFGHFKGGFLTCIIARLLDGIVVIVAILITRKMNIYLRIIIVSALSVILNTVFVLMFISIFSGKDFWYWFVIVGINVAVEWPVTIFAMVMLKPLIVYLRNLTTDVHKNSYV